MFYSHESVLVYTIVNQGVDTFHNAENNAFGIFLSALDLHPEL